MQLTIYKKCCLSILTILPIFFCSAAHSVGRVAALHDLKADLRFRLGVYREEELKSSALKGLLKKKGEESSASPVRDFRSFLNNRRNYAALVDIAYLLNARVLGKFGAAIGYVYKSEAEEQNPLDDLKNKVKSLSLPYAELSWEKSGILFIESMSLRAGVVVMGKSEKEKGFPTFFSSGLAYKIGGVVAVYAGMQYPTHFPSFKTEGMDHLKVVLGVEFAL